MTNASLLALYGVALFAASLLGSGLPRLVVMTHTRTQMVLSLISGLMLGVALLHLIPHSFSVAKTIDTVMLWTLAGLIFMLLLLRWFHFHQHDFGGAAEHCELSSADAHHHAHAHDHAHLPERAMGAMGLFSGFSVHTVVDGIALGAVLASAQDSAALAGAGVFLAILLHKPLDALSIETVMSARGWSSSARWSAGTVFALLCPLTAALFYFGASATVTRRDTAAGRAGLRGRGLHLYRAGRPVARGPVPQPRSLAANGLVLIGCWHCLCAGVVRARPLRSLTALLPDG